MNGQNGKADGVSSTIGPETHKNGHANFASDDVERKAFTSMQARAALCGCTLHELSDGYLVGRWGYCKAVPCLRAVGDLLRQIGGRS